MTTLSVLLLSNVAAIWSTEHALAWHLDEAFRANSGAWATAKCRRWDTEEEHLPNFLVELLDCPCTLAQARADTGRFHVGHWGLFVDVPEEYGGLPICAWAL